MPQFSYPIPDVYDAITRPVNVAVIKQIIAISGMDENTFIEYAGMNEGIATYKSLLNQEMMPSGRFANFEKVQVTVEEKIDEDYYLSSTYFDKADSKTVWKDSDIGIMLRPFYEKVKVTINFKYRAIDQGQMRNWQSGLKRRIKMDWLDQSLQAKYNVIIDPVLMAFFREFHRMSQAVAPTNEEFDAWMDKRFLQAHSTLTTMNGSHPQMVLEETQLDVVGWFDFTEIPREQKSDGQTAFETDFTYQFQYERPTEFGLNYPLVIHNQMMRKQYRPDFQVYDPVNLRGYAARSVSAYHTILRNMGNFDLKSRNGRIVPWFDDWWQPRVPANTTNLLQTLVKVDPNDPTLVVDLKDISSWKYSEGLWQCIVDNYADLTIPGRCVLLLSLYRNNDMIDYGELYVDDQYCVRTRVPMLLDKMYHLRFGLFDNLFYLTAEAELYLREHPTFCHEVFVSLDDRMANYLPEPVEGWFIARSDYRVAVERLNTTSDHFKVGFRSMRPTQLSTLITVPE